MGHLELNKYRTIHFEKTNCSQVYNIDSNNAQPQHVSPTTEDRDLGLIIDNKMEFTLCTRLIIGKASQRLGLPKSTIFSRAPQTMLKLYKALVWPVIENGMTVLY